MFELGSELNRQRERISRRRKRYLWFQIPAILLVIFGYIMFSIGATEVIISLTAGGLSFLGCFIVGGILNRLAESHRLSIEESLFLRVCSAIDDLCAYLEDGKEPDRRRAERQVKKISKRIQGWSLGKLKLPREILGSHIELFQQAFQSKMVSAVKQREKPDLEAAYRTLKEFAGYLVSSDPKVESLNSMTKSMDDEIKVGISLTMAPSKRLFGFLKDVNVIRHLSVVTIAFLSSVLVGYVGYYVVGISKDNTYIISVTTGLAIVGAYLNYLRK